MMTFTDSFRVHRANLQRIDLAFVVILAAMVLTNL